MKNIIAVWGNSGAGKSLVACALANALTANGGNAIIISADKLTPMLPVFLPLGEWRPEASLGALLAAPVTEERMKHTIQIHPQNAHLGYMGLLATDNGLSYQSNWQTDYIHQLVQILMYREYADHILFDCTGDLLADNVTLYALKNAHHVVRVLSPDLRGISFATAGTPILQSGGFPTGHITVLNNAFEYSPAVQLRADYALQHILPHCRDAYEKFISGRLIERLTGAGSVGFERGLGQIYQKVVTAHEQH